MEITFDARNLGIAADVLDGIAKQTPDVISRALNWTGNKARTKAVRVLADVAGLSYGRTRAATYTKPASKTDLEYYIGTSGTPIPLAEFNARQTARGVSAAPWGVRRVFPHTFIVKKLGGQVFVREGNQRFPLKKLWGPSLPKELVRDVVPAAFKEVADAEFAPRVLADLARLFPDKEQSKV